MEEKTSNYKIESDALGSDDSSSSLNSSPSYTLQTHLNLIQISHNGNDSVGSAPSSDTNNHSSIPLINKITQLTHEKEEVAVTSNSISER